MQPTHCLSLARARETAESAPVSSYGRLFPDLPSFTADEEFLLALGRAGGVCDCAEPNDSAESLSTVAAGWPFFGQFVGHDITADRSAIASRVDPSRLKNARSAQLNLECLYGDGPVGHAFMYRRDDPAKLLTASGGRDVLRNAEGTAIIGDPRNDSHVVISQLHLRFVDAHNAFVDRARAAATSEGDLFDVAARELRWHYQSVVLNEFLPSLIGRRLTDELLCDGCRFYRPSGTAYIPLEFADAAYRYGHSQIRQRYVLRGGGAAHPLFPDLIGFRPVPADCVVDWACFFDDGSRNTAQRAKRIDGRMVKALIELPVAIVGDTEVEAYHSLAMRDLQRGQHVGLPSGESLAKLLGETPLSGDEIGAVRAGWRGETPLWYYILREADVRCAGNALGPVGGRIIGEVLVGLLDHDPTSVRFAPADWRPVATLFELLSGRIGPTR